jgi:CRP/FNR family transcriptional regulator, cyclic AMP receptor protein
MFDYPTEQRAERRGFLADLHEDEVASIVAYMQSRRYAPGEIAVRAGDVDRSLFVVTSGRFDVVAHARPVAALPRGDIFGELAFFDGLPRSADVVAAELSETLVMTPAGLDRLRLNEPRLAFLLLMDLGRLLSLRVRHAERGG